MILFSETFYPLPRRYNRPVTVENEWIPQKKSAIIKEYSWNGYLGAIEHKVNIHLLTLKYTKVNSRFNNLKN